MESRQVQQRMAIQLDNLDVWFEKSQILFDISIPIQEHAITSIIGPSGSGKSTLLRCINRMNDSFDGFRATGSIVYKEKNVLLSDTNVFTLRKEVGMIFQKPTVFPISISKNVLFGLKKGSGKNVESFLRSAALWDEVKEKLGDSASVLSLGQQQRLCLARALAVEPSVLLMDEPTSALDPLSTLAIEKLMMELKKQYTIVVVTHDLEQARRISDYVVFMCNGRVIEKGFVEDIVKGAKRKETREYLSWKQCTCQ